MPASDLRFDPGLEASPFELFRRCREGRPPLLIDVRPIPGPLSLQGAVPHPSQEWSPPVDQDVVLFDDDGTLALAAARRLQAAGFPRVRALFGGLELYDFSLDPEVVGEERFLIRRINVAG